MTSKIKEKSLVMLGEEDLRLEREPKPNNQRTPSFPLNFTGLLLMPGGSMLCAGKGEGYCRQPYPCICKDAVSEFEPMTNKSSRHDFTAVPGLVLK